jgi:hypothetical protein
MFFNHGAPGKQLFGSKPHQTQLDAVDFGGGTKTGKTLVSLGLDNLFLPGAAIFFPNCKLVDFSGCKAGNRCDPSQANGLLLMERIAKTFLVKGGRLGGYDSSSFAAWGGLDSFLTGGGNPLTPVYRFWGDLYWCIIRRGRIRFAIGRASMSPAGNWYVVVGQYVFEYAFFEYAFQNGIVTRKAWNPGAVVHAAAGNYVLKDGWLQITWPLGASESWELPLFEKHQTGIAKTNSGIVELYATKQPPNYLSRGVWPPNSLRP